MLNDQGRSDWRSGPGRLSTPELIATQGRNTLDPLRNTLNREMRRTLAQLELVSAIPAQNHDASHGTDDDPLGRRPPGDYGYRVFAEWYGDPFCVVSVDAPGCVTNAEREQCIEAARRELAHLRKSATRDPSTLESPELARAQLLEETAGWNVASVCQSHWRVSATLLRRVRVADGRDAETGLPVEIDDGTGEDLASRARRMKGAGMSLRAIGMALGGLDQKQIQRFLRKVA